MKPSKTARELSGRRWSTADVAVWAAFVAVTLGTVAGTVFVDDDDDRCEAASTSVEEVADRYDEHLERAEAIEDDVEDVQRTIQVQQTAERIVEFVVQPFGGTTNEVADQVPK